MRRSICFDQIAVEMTDADAADRERLNDLTASRSINHHRRFIAFMRNAQRKWLDEFTNRTLIIIWSLLIRISHRKQSLSFGIWLAFDCAAPPPDHLIGEFIVI